MLKFTSVSDSAQGITGITRPVTTIDLITDRIIGTVGTAITATITPIITGASLI